MLRCVLPILVIVAIVTRSPLQAQRSQAQDNSLILQSAHGDVTSEIVFSHNGSLAASLGLNGVIKVWDVGTGQTVRNYKSQRVLGLRPYLFMADDRQLAIGTEAGTITLIDLLTNDTTQVASGLATPLTSLAVNADGKWLAAGDTWGNISLIGLSPRANAVILRTGETPNGDEVLGEDFLNQLERLKAKQEFISYLAFSPASDQLGVAFGNGNLSIISLSSHMQTLVKPLGDVTITALRFNSQNHLLAGLIRQDDKTNLLTSGVLQVVDATEDRTVLNVRTKRVGSVELDGNASEAILLCRTQDDASGHKTDLRIWMLSPLREVALQSELKAIDYEVPFSVSADGSKLMLMAGSRLKSMYILDLARQKYNLVDVSPVHEISRVQILPDHHLLAVGSDNLLAEWDLTTGEPIHSYAQMGQAAYSPDARWKAYVSWDSKLHVRDRLAGTDVASPFTSKGVGSIAIAPDGRLVIWSDDYGYGGSTRIWRVGEATSRELCFSETVFGTKSPISISLSGKYLAASCAHLPSGESEVFVWNASDLSLKRHFAHVIGLVQSLGFSGDEKHFAYTQAFIFVHDLDNNDDDHGLMIGGEKVESQLPPVINDFMFEGKDTIVASAGAAFEPPDSIQICAMESAKCKNRLKLSSGVTTISGSARYTAIGQSDGSTSIFDSQSQSIVLRIFTVGLKDWLAVTPEGLFDGTADAMHWISWPVPNTTTVVPLETFYNNYFYPGLVADILEDHRPKPLSGPIAQLLSLPGTLSMVNAGQASISKRGGKIILCVPEKEKSATEAENIQLFKGGERLDLSQIGFTEDLHSTDCRYRKQVNDDGQQYEFVARKFGRKSSLPGSNEVPMTRHYAGDPAPATLHVLTVGVSTYQNSPYTSLSYSALDAIAIDQYFQKQASSQWFRSIHVWNRYEDAGEKEKHESKDDIMKLMADMEAAVKLEDTVFIFLSGHGKIPPGQEMFYFLPHFEVNFWDKSSFEERKMGIGTHLLAEFVRKLKARRIALIIDACESGGIAESLVKVAEIKQKTEARRNLLNSSTPANTVGIHVIAAAIPLEEAASTKAEQHSRLTTALLEALERKAQSNTDATIWISDIVEHINLRLPQLARNDDQTQSPLIVSIGTDFPIAVVH